MKNLLIASLLLLAVSSGFQFTFCNAQTSALSAEAIFEKVVQYYDPKGVWDEYEGSMRIYSIFDNSIGKEEITINNARGFYQTILHLNDSTFTKGIKEGVFFFEINGKPLKETEVPEKFKNGPYNLTSHNIKMLREHHTFHFSGPLMLKASGATPSEKVGSEDILGTTCVSIYFPEGLPNNYEQGGYNGAITLYLNPKENYKLHAIHLHNGWFKDEKGMLTLYSGEIEVGGVKIPSRRLYFHAADRSYGFIDAFESISGTK